MMRCRPGIVTGCGVWDDPGTAAHHFMLRRIWETVVVYGMRYGSG